MREDTHLFVPTVLLRGKIIVTLNERIKGQTRETTFEMCFRAQGINGTCISGSCSCSSSSKLKQHKVHY